jgi:hypothetical protein
MKRSGASVESYESGNHIREDLTVRGVIMTIANVSLDSAVTGPGVVGGTWP